MRSVLSSSHWSHPDLVRLAEAYDVVAYVNFGYNGDNAVGFNHSLRVSKVLAQPATTHSLLQ